MSDSDKNRGLYEKFTVIRTDGSSAEGGKHHGCFYFVLDLDHDKFAINALRAYAVACEKEYPALASDMKKIIARKIAEMDKEKVK
jgi:hypothetical protein